MIPEKRPISWLTGLIDVDNIAAELDQELLNDIGYDVTKTYDQDDASRADWKRQSESAMKLAKQLRETKSDPWPGCANVKYPLMTVAAIQFAARAYPEICKGDQIVRCAVEGEDPDGSKEARAGRISKHMNWQLTKQMKEWEDDTDTLLHILPIVGCCFRKSYFDLQLDGGRNVSELVLPDDLVVNNKARTLEKARRATHRYYLYENDIYERQKSGVWLDVDLGESVNPKNPDDRDKPHEFLEQHRYWDLDGDGYQEPYIVTVHKLTNKVVRIDARFSQDGIQEKGGRITRINPDHYLTCFKFLPNPDGSFYPVGFGQLLEPINDSVNTVLNQLLDAGTLANLGGGFLGRGIKIRGGQVLFKPGEWKPVDTTGAALRDNVFPLPVKDASPVLFQLLGMLVNAAKEITAIKDITGEGLSANTPAHTALAIMEQGQKVFSAIYKRIYRGLGDEFEKLYQLNARYMPEEETFRFGPMMQPQPPMQSGMMGQTPGMPQGMPGMPPQMGMGQPPVQQVAKADYQAEDLTVYPVADPNLATDVQRALKTQALLQLSGRPGMNEIELTKRAIHSIHPNDEDKMFQMPQAPPPNPDLIKVQAELHDKGVRLHMDMLKFDYEMEELKAKIAKTKADSILALAKAEDTERGDLVEVYKAEMDQINNEINRRVAMAKDMAAQQAQAQQQGGQPSAGGGPSAAPNPNMAGIPGRAAGGPVNAMQPYVVGEQGPEVIVPQQAGVVVPNQALYAKPGPYMTVLPPDQEQQFMQWVIQNKVPFDPNAATSDYDMRGFFQALQAGDPRAHSAIDPNDQQLHFTDYWKTPTHATFSRESKYATEDAPHWEGDKLIDKDGRVIYDDAAQRR